MTMRTAVRPGDGMEQAVAAAGLYPDNRSGNKGTEPEGVEVARFGGSTFAFIALERANAMAVYRLENETQPRFVQVLATGVSPEGVLAIPRRNLLVTDNEIDGSLSVFAP